MMRATLSCAPAKAGASGNLAVRMWTEVNADPKTGGDRREDVLANAPVAEHGFFGVPKVIE